MATAQQEEPLYRIYYPAVTASFVRSAPFYGMPRRWSSACAEIQSLRKPRAGWGLRVERI